MALKTEFTVIWVVLCSAVVGYQHSRELCCLHLQATTQKITDSINCEVYAQLTKQEEGYDASLKAFPILKLSASFGALFFWRQLSGNQGMVIPPLHMV